MATMHYRPGVEAVPGYKLVELLGRGGFGEVWKAQGPGGVILAVKVIDKVDDKAGRKEFRALKLIRNLRHPNLVSISGFWLRDADGNPIDPEKLTDDPQGDSLRPSELIVAMDMGEMSLLQRLEECRRGISPDSKGGIPFDELIEYMEAAARAIDYLNIRHDIQHRDIKPQNILIVGGSAQVCDFGLASAVSSVRTSMGGAGSLAYMAPEIYTTKRPSRSTDQYGLAIAYVELRTGRLPLSDTESYAVLDEAKRQGKLDLSWLDEGERKVIERATHLVAEERFPRCVDMVQALRNAVSPSATVTPRTTEAVRPIGDYQPERQIYRRSGEEIWEAVSPERHHVTLVVREVTESPDLTTSAALPLSREASKKHDHLAEVYEYVRVSETGKVAPARLFDGPHPPGFAKLLLAGKLCSGNMNDRMTSGGLSAGQMLEEMEQLAEAVDFLNDARHERDGKKLRLMHLNVRPANFQFDGHDVMLGNFSSCQILDGDEQPFPAGRLLSDSAYNPPEFTAERLTRWSDQYQLAVAYLQMRTGKPSSGLTGSHGGERHALGVSRLDLSDLLQNEKTVVARATATNPRERYDDCKQMVAALAAAWTADRTDAGLSDKPSTTTRGSSQPTIVPDHRTVVGGITGSDSRGEAVGELRAPAIQGTLAAPPFGETVLHRDTDPEGDRRQTLARPVPTARVQPPPVAGRKSTNTLRNGVLVAAIILAGLAGWKFILSPGNELSSALDERIQQGNYLAAIEYLDETSNEMSEETKEGFRLKVRAAWFKDNIKPQVRERKYSEALDTIDAADRKLASKDLFDQWKREVLDDWYAYASELTGKEPAAAPAQFNAILRKRGPYLESVRLRADALDALLKNGVNQVADKPEDAYATLSQVVAAIDAAKGIESLPVEAERSRRRQALVHRARAAARLKQWDKVKADLKQLAGQLSTGKEVALGELLGLLSDTSESSAADRLAAATALRRKAGAGDFDPWEKQELANAIATLQRVLGGARYQQFQQMLTDAEAHADASRFADASAAIAKIRADEALREYIKGNDQRRVDRLQVLCTLGRPESKPAEINAAFDLAEQDLVQATSGDGALVKLCEALAKRAIERDGSATGNRKMPELLERTLSIAGKAKSLVKVDSPDEKKLLAVLASLGDEYLADVRRLRDLAGTAATEPGNRESWTRLRDKARQSRELSLRSRVALAARIEASLVLGESAKSLADAAKALSSKGAAASTDDRYVNYVLARFAREEDRLGDAAAAIAAAWQGQYPSRDKAPPAEPEETWQNSATRRRAATDILVRSVTGSKTGPDHDPALGENSTKGDRFTAAAAAAVYKQLALARHLAAGAGFDVKRTADADLLRLIDENFALAAAYQPATADEGIRLTDALIDGSQAQAVSTQVYVANLRLHGERFRKASQPADRDRAIIAYSRLLALCEAKYYDVKATTLFDRVIEPGFALAAADNLPKSVLPDAARLAAARGRYIRSIGAIEERFAEAKDGPDQVAYDSYDRAIKLDPTVAESYVGRSMAFQDLMRPTAERKAAVLRENADLAEKYARDAQERNILEGLRALALYQESNWIPDYDVKRAKLAEAVKQLAKVYEASGGASRTHAGIYYALRATEGGAYLHLANYVPSLKAKEAHLNRAKEIARSLAEGDDNRFHPEWAYLLWGNTEEDVGMFLKENDSYESAIRRFSTAQSMSEEDRDPKGQSSALLARGRCRYRQALAASKDDSEKRSRLNQALDDLNKSITVAGKWPLQQAEAYRWIGMIYQQPLTAEPAKATDSFEKAAALAKEVNPSWPLYVITRAEHALFLARGLIDPANLRRPQPPADRLLADAREIAQALLDDTADARIHDRHRFQAALVIAQSHIWEGSPQKAGALLDKVAPQLDADDAFALASGIAGQLLDLPNVPAGKRRLSDEEIALSRKSFAAALERVAKLPVGDKAELFDINLRYYNLWNPLFAAAFDKFKADATAKRSMLDMMHHVRFHLAVGVKLQSDPEWKSSGRKVDENLQKTLGQYTKYLLDETNGETDWNQPGRDKKQYREDAGL